MSGVAPFAGEEQIELVLRGCDWHGHFDAYRSEARRTNRYEQRLGRFTTGIQVFNPALNQAGSGERLQIGEGRHTLEGSDPLGLLLRRAHGGKLGPEMVPDSGRTLPNSIGPPQQP